MSEAKKRYARAVEEYNSQGYTIIPGVLDDATIDGVREHFHWLLKKHPDRRSDDLNTDLVVGDPFWVELVGKDQLLDVAEAFIGPDIALFASHYIAKEPHTGRPVLWHQDGAYWPLDPMEVITFWLAVTKSDVENGCMRIIPGTQGLNLKELQERKDIDSVLGSSIDEAEVQEEQAVDLELEPGDVSIHHPNIIHGSNPNNSHRWRIGLTIRYIPTTTAITNQDAGAPYLLRGKPVEGINNYHPLPVFDSEHHFRWGT